MAEQQVSQYGYASDDVKLNPFNFGLNQDVRLIKFEWIPNGGKDGAEQEALDIVFKINDVEKSYRMFPVTQAFGENNEKVTDPNSKEMKDAFADSNARVVHILHCFRDIDSIKAAFSKRIDSFKDYCIIAMSGLPKDYSTKPLDIFLQWGYNLGDKEKTYLEIPSKMKYGKWLCEAKPGVWSEHRVESPADSVREALYYTNEKGEKHLFVKNGWFMNSNFAKQQRSAGSEETGGGSASANATSTQTTETAKPAPQASAW